MTSTPVTQRSMGGKIFSRLLHAYFLAMRGLTIGVRAVVRSDEGKFLLVRHTYTQGWHFPGGGVEKGETAERALDHELRQETGLKLAGKPALHGVLFNRGVSKRDHVLVYLCDVEGDLPEKSSSMEILEVGFFSLDELPEGTDPGTERRMREIAEGLEQAVEW